MFATGISLAYFTEIFLPSSRPKSRIKTQNNQKPEFLSFQYRHVREQNF